jgi:hypothetical protein
VVENFSSFRLSRQRQICARWVAMRAWVVPRLRHVENRHRLSDFGAMYSIGNRGGNRMPEVTIVYWRDIPAQVIVGKGRRGSKIQLTERFEQAIDRCAMKVGARDTDSYLAEWRKAAPYEVEGDPDEIVKSVAAQLEAEFDTARLKALIDAEGWAKA